MFFNSALDNFFIIKIFKLNNRPGFWYRALLPPPPVGRPHGLPHTVRFYLQIKSLHARGVLYFTPPMQKAFFQNIFLKIQNASYPLLCVYIHKRCFIFYTGKIPFKKKFGFIQIITGFIFLLLSYQEFH
ncbi:MAG: hypothetical protein B6D37_10860 [Sphingobacteriales bacterium UTBCD1]|jgi:hypothetical protein|nr:MAG: hypothetical protein B6D37_10860 [Sphingobacteriales bacterium UTBCD1]